MASSYPASVGAVQVGSYFVQQYYKILQQQPDFVHHFYKDASTMVRIDGDANKSASAVLQIHTLIMSLNFTGIEIKTINSLESWNGGVLVVVSGSVKSKDFSGWRKFLQSFFLAPQENGYFVLNDIFHFASDDVINHHPVSLPPENRVDSPVTNDSRLPDSPAHHDYASLEVEPSENMDSIHIEDDAVQDYTMPEEEEEEEEEQQQPPPQPQPQPHQQLQMEEEQNIPESSIEQETPAEESYSLPPQNVVEAAEPEHLPADAAEPVGKLTYASILQAPKGKYAPSVASQPIVNKTAIPASDWPQMPQPAAQPLNHVPPPVPNNSTIEVVADEGLSQEEVDSKSIYVRNLPTTVYTFDIVKEFKKFGAIKTDGVVMKNRKETGVCFAFVEYEDAESAQNAIKASPIQLEGRQVYIEERRTNSTPGSRGGRGRGRGRGNYQNEGGRGGGGGRFGGRNFGRGINQDGSDNYRARGNGVRGSY